MRPSYTLHTSPFKGAHGLTRTLLTQLLQARLAKAADAQDESALNFAMFHASDVPVQHRCLMSMMSLNVIITHDLEPLHGLHASKRKLPQMHLAIQQLCTKAASRCAGMYHAT